MWQKTVLEKLQFFILNIVKIGPNMNVFVKIFENFLEVYFDKDS